MKLSGTDQNERALNRSGRRFGFMMIALTVLLLWSLILNVNSGSVKIPAADVFSMIGGALKYKIVNLLTGGCGEELAAVTGATAQSVIIFTIRIPRMLLAAILGGALAVAGFLLQTFFRNPIAGPFVLGISSGAKMVVGLVLIVLADSLGSISSFILVVAAFIGSLLVVGFVLMISRKVRNMAMLLVAGVMVSYICSAVTDFLITFAEDSAIVNLQNWSMGSFSAAPKSNRFAKMYFCSFFRAHIHFWSPKFP